MQQMNSYEAIFKRKSIRKYDLVPLNENILKEILIYLSTLKPMYAEIKTEMKIVSQNEISKLLSIKAPHYIVVSSENKEGYLTNVGFMLQQMDLYFSAHGFGSCWAGMAKPTKAIEINTDLEFVIVIAFGMPAEPLYRECVLDFKRKPLEQISNIIEKNELLESARLAPSATNSQPWYFKVDDGAIHTYCVKSNILKAFLYEKMNKVDMGIAICHLWLTAKHLGKNVEFLSDRAAKDSSPKGYYYITTLKV